MSPRNRQYKRFKIAQPQAILTAVPQPARGRRGKNTRAAIPESIAVLRKRVASGRVHEVHASTITALSDWLDGSGKKGVREWINTVFVNKNTK